jgi:hypothetical protein
VEDLGVDPDIFAVHDELVDCVKQVGIFPMICHHSLLMAELYQGCGRLPANERADMRNLKNRGLKSKH